MLSPNDVLLNGLTASKELIISFCRDLKPDELLHRPSPAANCAAWLLGHLTLSDRRVMKMVLGAEDLPPLPDETFEQRFGREEGRPQAPAFGDTSILLPLFAETRDVLIGKVAALDPDVLGSSLSFSNPRFATVYGAINFMGVHTAMHAGQISMIRRSLGRPPLV